MELWPLSSKFTLFSYFMKTNLGLLNTCPLPDDKLLSLVTLESGRDLACVLLGGSVLICQTPSVCWPLQLLPLYFKAGSSTQRPIASIDFVAQCLWGTLLHEQLSSNTLQNRFPASSASLTSQRLYCQPVNEVCSHQ